LTAFLLSLFAALICGALSAMGIGGGTLLIIYMSFAASFDQTTAQGYNLLYFLAVALASLLFHIKNKLIDFKPALIIILAGLPASALGAFLALKIRPDLLRKLFGGLLFYIGLTMLFSKKAKEEHSETT